MADPERFDADPDPSFQADTDPDPDSNFFSLGEKKFFSPNIRVGHHVLLRSECIVLLKNAMFFYVLFLSF